MNTHHSKFDAFCSQLRSLHGTSHIACKNVKPTKVPPTSTDKIVQGLTVPNASQSTSASAQLPTAPTTAATFTPNNNNSSKGGDVKNDNDDDDDNSNNDGNDSKHDGSSIDSSSGNGSGATTLEDLEARFAALRR